MSTHEIQTTPAGTKKWYQNGHLHRTDGPAVIGWDGTTIWYRYGKRHRVDGPAVIKLNGDETWYWRGSFHRVDGPAINRQYREEWRRHGMLHRLDGPAIIYSDEGGGQSWWIQGHHILSWLAYQTITKCRDSDIVMLKIKYGEIEGY